MKQPTLPRHHAILVEDEQAVRLATAQTLELGGFSVQACASAEQAFALINADFGGIVVTDVRLPQSSGLDLLAHTMHIDADLPVILVTGHGDVVMAVQALKNGAYDFIEKPFASERLLESCLRAQEKRSLVLENRRLSKAWAAHPSMPELIGQSPSIERLRKIIQNIGPTPADVLINGATGSGKEVVARQLHLASRRKGEFVAINCAALPESMFESEIFGNEVGAFTGAQKRRIGKLEYAQGGTVFLDEIESMPMALQVKMLRVLQERQLERLGGNATVQLDCRVIAATKVDLRQLSTEGSFREDLYYRIGVVSVDLPRLNDRREDIPLLLAHFLQRAALRYQKPIPFWSPLDMAQWQQRDWPGNVRELRNFADRLVLGVAEMHPADSVKSDIEELTLPRRLDVYEEAQIVTALRTHEFNVALTAANLGIPKKTLYDKLKKYGLSTGKLLQKDD
ncbi:sigma-54 dependent transcriptional regulator [Rhodoferax saidenbachensis]|uniref:Two-component system C4-dicarboxylate transport response regulator DctD n=1 Tax=Rhodoferax saidenbachensis TaxID=1484693 RepID=A0ABU1ZUW4_9BURK|nr:sigma-54 dependent transcriptional regulator [Rhodoferax saidenbachensis]MDR7308635.1 two-component system C4-dicarboxylate transport response regulator DctD [Rhodoferax saidenbachensis]